MRSLSNVFLRKIRSAILLYISKNACLLYTVYLNNFVNGITVGPQVKLGRGVRFSCTDGGLIVIEANASIGDYSKINAKGGKITIGKNVFIGDACILVSQSEVKIGADTLIAEYVVIRDQDHLYSTRPIRSSGFITEPIKIGSDCWIGAKATILRGAYIDDGSVIGAHALVKGYIPPNSLAVGIPAKIKNNFHRS